MTLKTFAEIPVDFQKKCFAKDVAVSIQRDVEKGKIRYVEYETIARATRCGVPVEDVKAHIPTGLAEVAKMMMKSTGGRQE